MVVTPAKSSASITTPRFCIILYERYAPDCSIPHVNLFANPYIDFVTITRLLLKLMNSYLFHCLFRSSSFLSIEDAVTVLVEVLGYHEISVAYITVPVQIETNVRLALRSSFFNERSQIILWIQVLWTFPPTWDLYILSLHRFACLSSCS